jgi:uncharacterized Zn-binding protein involved in type VI secretion
MVHAGIPIQFVYSEVLNGDTTSGICHAQDNGSSVVTGGNILAAAPQKTKDAQCKFLVGDRLQCSRCPEGMSWDARSEVCRDGAHVFVLGRNAHPNGYFDKPVGDQRQMVTWLVDMMFAALSNPGGEERFLEAADKIYADRLVYFGKMLTKREVLEDKSKFMLKWPSRNYHIRLGSKDVVCNPGGGCLMKGIYDFTVSSTDKTITGSADFTYEFDVRRDHVYVTREDGNVLERRVSSRVMQ